MHTSFLLFQALLFALTMGGDPKPIELIHVSPRVAIGSANLDFQVRLVPVASDRKEYALLCASGEQCSLRFSEHERMSQIDIEGETAPKLWHPKTWQHIGPGDYWLIAAVGPWEGFRAVVREHILVSDVE